MNELLKTLKVNYLLVNSTNEYLVEYSHLSENARYTLTGFSGSTGDALVTKNGIYLFVDGRYHEQADNEVFKNITVCKLQLGQSQDKEIANFIDENSTFCIVSKKVSQARLENFKKLLKDKNIEFKLISDDIINNHTEEHNTNNEKVKCENKTFTPKIPTLITNLEEVSYLTGLRNFSKDNSSKIWKFLYTDNCQQIL